MRLIAKFGVSESINIEADCICRQDGYMVAWNGERIVFVVKEEELKFAYLSERNK